MSLGGAVAQSPIGGALTSSAISQRVNGANGRAMALAAVQVALRVRQLEPALLGSKWMIDGTLLYNDAEDYFGVSNV